MTFLRWKNFRWAGGVAFLALPAFAAAASPKANPEVLVVAEARTDIPELLRPTPGKPIYYVLGKIELTLGESVAGIKMPTPAVVEKSVVAALASQGFVRTEIGGPIPSIYIVAAWGDANFADLDIPPDPNDAEAVANDLLMRKTKPTARDRVSIENLVGLNKAFSLPVWEQQKILTASNEDRLYISLAALDVNELRQKKRRLLWRTNMTIDGRLKLADTLPVMLASAAPYFGRALDHPVFVDDKLRRESNVEIGDMKVIADEVKPPPSPKK